MEEEQKKREEEKRKRDEEKEKKKREQILKSPAVDSEAADGGQDKKKADQETGMDPAKLKKNFASLDCGAKVVGANPESQSALNIITPSRDEYMLNKCTDKAWFIIELCESIKATKIEIANFELYSSVPNEFRVLMGNVVNGREKDWGLFGHFHAEDDRSVQSFSSPGVFGKFVKVEVLSHHGHEHYCPISLFKIFGISEIELIGADDEDDDDHDSHHQDVDIGSSQEHSQDGEESSKKSGNVFSFLKETVGGTLKRIAGVFSTSNQIKDLDMTQALEQSSLIGSTFMYQVICPGCDINRYRDVYFLLASNFVQLSSTLEASKGLKAKLESSVCDSYGFDLTTSGSGTGGTDQKTESYPVGVALVEFYATLFGTSRIMALCNVLKIKRGQWTLADQKLVLPPRELKSDGAVIDDKNSSSVSSGTTTPDPQSPPVNSEEDQMQPLPPLAKPSIEVPDQSIADKTDQKSAVNKRSSGAVDPTSMPSSDSTLSSQQFTMSQSNDANKSPVGFSKSAVNPEDVTVTNKLTDTDSAIDSKGGVDSAGKTDGIKPTKVAVDQVVASTPVKDKPKDDAQGKGSSTTTSTTDEKPPGQDARQQEGQPSPGPKDPPRVVIVPPIDKSQVVSTPSSASASTSSSDSLNLNLNSNNNNQAGRESVWQKLSNRIKVCIQLIVSVFVTEFFKEVFFPFRTSNAM